jgi:hypothetical protein
MKRKCVRSVAIALAVLCALSAASWLVYQTYWKYWKRVETLDVFAILFVEMGWRIESHPAGSPSDLQKGMLERYRERTGESDVLDGWGRAVDIAVYRHSGSIGLDLKSAGVDGVPGTADDVVQSHTFSTEPAPLPD